MLLLMVMTVVQHRLFRESNGFFFPLLRPAKKPGQFAKLFFQPDSEIALRTVGKFSQRRRAAS